MSTKKDTFGTFWKTLFSVHLPLWYYMLILFGRVFTKNAQLLWDILSDYLILMHSESRTNSINTPSWHVLHNQLDTWFGWMNKTWLFPRDWLSTLVLRCGWEKKKSAWLTLVVECYFSVNKIKDRFDGNVYVEIINKSKKWLYQMKVGM